MPKRETKNYTPETAFVEGLIHDPFTFFCVYCSEFAIILDVPLEKVLQPNLSPDLIPRPK